LRGLKLSVQSGGDTASTLERTVLDEAAVGTMGIEWTSERGLSHGEEECAVAGNGGERKRKAFGPLLAEDPADNDRLAIGGAEFGLWCVPEGKRHVNK